MEHELGPEISVDGMPSWLGGDEKVKPRWDKDDWYPDILSACCVASPESVTAIRLRADHPIYEVRLPEHRTSTPTRPSDELVRRMRSSIYSAVSLWGHVSTDDAQGVWLAEARAILADLNPDPMIQRARDICKDEFGVILPDDAPGMRAVLRGLREGG